MANQATVRTNGMRAGRRGTVVARTGDATAPEEEAGPSQVISGVSEFSENLLTLAELQARLAAIELRQNLEATRFTGSVVLAGATLALASLPVLLIGIAELLASGLRMNRGLAFLSVSAVALLIGGACILIAGSRLRRSAVGFPITREEFARNVNWIRTVLLHSGRPVRGR
jgi:uncharacterized membrane protein YqjE